MPSLYPELDALQRTARGKERHNATNAFLGTQITSDLPTINKGVGDVILPILERRLGPELAQALAKQAGRPGASIEGVLSGLATSGGFEIAQQLSGIQSEIARARSGIPRNQDVGTAIGIGALGGFVGGGGGGGAVAGALGGAIGANSSNKANDRAKRKAREAGLAATPRAFGEEALKLEPLSREVALAGGAGARSAQNLEAAITASGLRDTGLGTLASIAAGVQVPLEGLSQSFSAAMQTINRRVESTLGAPVRPPNDNLAKALTGLATVALLRNRPQQNTGDSGFSTGLGSGQGDQTGFDIPLFSRAEDPGFTDASGKTFSGNF